MLKFGAVVLVLCGLALRHVNAVVTCTATCTATSVSWISCNLGGDMFKTIRFVTNAGEPDCTKAFHATNAGTFVDGPLATDFGAAPCAGVVISTDPTKNGLVSCEARLYVGDTLDDAMDVVVPCPCAVVNNAAVYAGTQTVTADVPVGTASIAGKANTVVPGLEPAKILDEDGNDKTGQALALGDPFTLTADAPDGDVKAGICWSVTLHDKVVPASIETVIKDKCSLTNHVAVANKAQEKAEPAAPGSPTTIKCEGLKAIKFIPSGTVVATMTAALCTTVGHEMCTPVPDCTARRKRRAASGEGFFTVERNVTISIQTEDPRHKENAGCEGYVSSTIFYVTVIVLAVLLVVTIGVAALFGTRARAVVLTGKDNPVYG